MSTRRVFRQAAGFTLVEVLVVLLILGIVSVGLYQMLITSRSSYDRQKATLEMQTNARTALEALAADFRHVSYGKDPTQPSIHFAGPDSVTFVADILPEVSGAERISYALGGSGDPDTPNPHDTILMKTVADSAGVLLFREPQSYGIRAGGLSFRYFNGMAVELASPVTHPELIGEIMIAVTAVEPRAHPRLGTYMEETLSATIYPRNLPLTPARSRPSRPQVGALVLPDCASATVPWTRPTTYTDGTPLPLNEISHYTLYVGTDPQELEVNARLARTFTAWTVGGLTGGQVYYFALTCTSTSEVESFYNLATLDLSSPLTPDLPAGAACVPNPHGPGVSLSWNAVTTFTDGAIITTPVQYAVYRDTSPGVVPGADTRLAIVPSGTTYTDETMADCAGYYFIVTAEACGNEGVPSAELFASRPAPPLCPSALAAAGGEATGTLRVTWAPPTSRQDGTPLSPADIQGYRIRYGTLPQVYDGQVDVPASPCDYTLGGLEACTTYYLNLTCIDACAHEGELCAFNEVSAATREECAPGPPAPVAFLRAEPLADRVALTWTANTGDCDLQAYRLYYGSTSGGPYDGSGALEGASPITLSSDAVVYGDSCYASLSGLALCQDYFVVVTAVDGCAPANESPLSPEAALQTPCSSCDADAGCVHYLAPGPSYRDVRLEAYATDGMPLAVTGLRPAWSGAALIEQVWAGHPLVKVWDANGSAGGDGNVGPRPSGTLLDLDDFTIPTSARRGDGLPMMLCFDADQRQQTLDLTFASASEYCDAAGRTIQEGALFDDFNDGNYAGWTVVSGTWSVVGGELYQSRASGTRTILGNDTFTDVSFEAKLKNTRGQTPSIVFRYLDGNNFYAFGLLTTNNAVRLIRTRNGSSVVTAQAARTLSNNTWYLLRVDVSGTTIRAYLDCELVLEVTDALIRPSGKIGFRDYASRTYFDDVRVAALTGGLP